VIPLKDSNPTERFPIVTVLFIALNILVFLYEISLGEGQGEYFVGAFALVPARLFHAATALPGPFPAGVTLFTSMFLHVGILHLAFNGYALVIIGADVERLLGWGGFLVLYLLSGLFGSLASYAFNTGISAGASGAIFGLIGGLAAFFALHRQ